MVGESTIRPTYITYSGQDGLTPTRVALPLRGSSLRTVTTSPSEYSTATPFGEDPGQVRSVRHPLTKRETAIPTDLRRYSLQNPYGQFYEARNLEELYHIAATGGSEVYPQEFGEEFIKAPGQKLPPRSKWAGSYYYNVESNQVTKIDLQGGRAAAQQRLNALDPDKHVLLGHTYNHHAYFTDPHNPTKITVWEKPDEVLQQIQDRRLGAYGTPGQDNGSMTETSTVYDRVIERGKPVTRTQASAHEPYFYGNDNLTVGFRPGDSQLKETRDGKGRLTGVEIVDGTLKGAKVLGFKERTIKKFGQPPTIEVRVNPVRQTVTEYPETIRYVPRTATTVIPGSTVGGQGSVAGEGELPPLPPYRAVQGNWKDPNQFRKTDTTWWSLPDLRRQQKEHGLGDSIYDLRTRGLRGR